MKIYNIFIISPYPGVCVGLSDILAKEEGLAVSRTADNYKEAMQLVNESNSNLVIADISLKYWGDISLIKDIKAHNTSLPILVYSACNEYIYAQFCLRLGARGYIMMNEPVEKTVEAIHNVLNGDLYVSDRIAKKMREFGTSSLEEYVNRVDLLTMREFQVFNLIGQNLSLEKIADTLRMTPGTAKTHWRNIIRKLRSPPREVRQFAISEVQYFGHNKMPE